MLVDLEFRDVRQIGHVTRVEHGLCPWRQLGSVEPSQHDRHEQRRHLIVGDRAVGIGRDQPTDLIGGELFAVALPLDQFDDAGGHAGSLADGDRETHTCAVASPVSRTAVWLAEPPVPRSPRALLASRFIDTGGRPRVGP